MEKKHILIALAAIMLVVGSTFTVRAVRERNQHTCYYGRRIAAADAKSDERYFGYIRSDNDYLYVKYLAEHGRNLILKINWNGEIAGVYDLDRDLVSFSIIDGSLYGMSMSPTTRSVVYVRYVL